MPRVQPISVKRSKTAGEYVVSMPPGWELRLRRVLMRVAVDGLPDPRESGLSETQRAARVQIRRRRLDDAVCRYIADVLTADIVGKEVAIASRSHFGLRRGSLREHVQSLLREVVD